MASLTQIEARAKLYADARERLSGIVAGLNAGIEALKRAAIPDIKRAIASAATHHDHLRTMIEDAPDLFVKPRSVVFHGIKLG